MPKNVLELWPQIFYTTVAILVLLGASLAFSFKYRSGAEAGRRGHREGEAEAEEQRVSPSGWISSFAGRVEEGGGGVPFIGLAIFLVTIIWYFVYLFLFWTPR